MAYHRQQGVKQIVDKTVWMTAEGYQKLQARLTELCTVRRPALVKDLQEVSGEADWRENAQLTLVQNELAQVDAEIRRLEDMLVYGEVVEPQKTNAIVDYVRSAEPGE
jgi:transcription elongation GreA/GreB family factor